MKTLVVFLLCLSFTFSCIGVPFWLVSCNPNVAGGCYPGDLLPGNLTSVSTSNNICCGRCESCHVNSHGYRQCAFYCCQRHACHRYNLHYQTDNGVCIISEGNFESSSDALTIGLSFGLYQKQMVVLNPNTQKCTWPGNSKSLWLLGVTFLGLTPFTLLCALGFHYGSVD